MPAQGDLAGDEQASKVRLFNDDHCFVSVSPEAAGFGELQLPDKLRWMQAQACFYCPLPPDHSGELALLMRAIPGGGPEIPYLSVKADGQEIGARQISKYGTYYFRLPSKLLQTLSSGSISFEVHTGIQADGLCDGAKPQVALYEARIIDLRTGSFPDREEFRQQVKLFQPEGGYFYEVLREYPFDPSQKLLEIGSGWGTLSALMAIFTKATVWGIDVVEYSNPNQRNLSQELFDRFRLNRIVLEQTPGLESAADPDAVREAIGRLSLLTMSAEKMLFADSTFDFVFSLNVMEHIPHPDRALLEIYRVLKPGRHALLQFSPLYYCDVGSHLFASGYNRPWAHLLMTRQQIKEACLREGGNANEVDNILDSLNGWRPQQYIDAVLNSGLTVLFRHIETGFATPGAAESAEYEQVRKIYSEEDLTTSRMLWFLEKPA